MTVQWSEAGPTESEMFKFPPVSKNLQRWSNQGWGLRSRTDECAATTPPVEPGIEGRAVAGRPSGQLVYVELRNERHS